MNRIFAFGKIDWNGSGRKSNLVTVDVSLHNNKDGFPEFTAFIKVWNARQTDILMGGQRFDDVKRVPLDNPLYQEIKGLWEKYHLNGMHLGTKAQEEAVKKVGLKGNYDKSVEYLKRRGLYEVRLTPTEKKYNPRYAKEPYRYGHGWFYQPIPATDLAKIKRIMALPRRD